MSLLVPMMAYIRAFFLPRHGLVLESVALLQQLAVSNASGLAPGSIVSTGSSGRWYSGWADALILVKPVTVVSWHRASFRLFWRWKSRAAGRPTVRGEVRLLIRGMKAENPVWGGPPNIHGELF